MAKKVSVAKSKIPASYILVTEMNRKFCIKMGRECYVLDEYDKLAGQFTIRPRLRKGWFEFGKHKCHVTEDESAASYAESFDSVISHFIKKKRLFIDSDKPLMEFKLPKEKK